MTFGAEGKIQKKRGVSPNESCPSAEQLKLVGLARAVSKHKDAFQAACWIAELLGSQQEEVCITQIYQYIAPEALGNSAGNLFRNPAVWEFSRWCKSTRMERHAGLIAHWRLVRNGNR